MFVNKRIGYTVGSERGDILRFSQLVSTELVRSTLGRFIEIGSVADSWRYCTVIGNSFIKITDLIFFSEQA